jgi:Mrp family chromosome partitioning ATPase
MANDGLSHTSNDWTTRGPDSMHPIGRPARPANRRAAGKFEELPVFEEAPLSLEHPSTDIKALFDPSSLVTEALRVLRARLRAVALEQPAQCVGVVSAVQGEGKTTLALGLARVLALEGQARVLLIEADLRRPAVDRSLGAVPPTEGLLQYLEGSSGSVTVRRLVPEGFYVLSAGPRADGQPELLSTPRMAALLAAARNAFDCVLLDCPPLTPVSDSLILEELLDGYLFVVRERLAPRETVLYALGLLKSSRTYGLVYNAQRDILPTYRSYVYRRYRTS